MSALGKVELSGLLHRIMNLTTEIQKKYMSCYFILI